MSPSASAGLTVSEKTAKSILTRTTGFLETVCSHSLQPYRGCSFGNALCGVGCYVRHNGFLTRGAAWGSFLEGRLNAPELYRTQVQAERTWARKKRGRFAVFMSSSTDPFVPQERRFQLTRRVLEAMLDVPPDELIVQTHSHRVTDYMDLYPDLSRCTDLRFHLSIESDRDRLPGLPPPASSVDRRFEAARALKAAGLRVVITVSPLLPIDDPQTFFERIIRAAVLNRSVSGEM